MLRTETHVRVFLGSGDAEICLKTVLEINMLKKQQKQQNRLQQQNRSNTLLYGDSSSNKSMETRIWREEKFKKYGKISLFYRVCNTATPFSIRAAAATSAPPSWSRSGRGAPATAETKRGTQAPPPFSRRGNQKRKDGVNYKAPISFFFSGT